MKTLTDFTASREPCADLGARFGAECFDGSPRAGCVYEGDCYIECETDGSFYLILCREEYRAATLAQLEPILYAWCVTEFPAEMDIPDDVHAFVCALQTDMPDGERNFATALLANLRETDPSVCHMHDYCDANQCALDIAGNDVEKACDLYNRARPVLRGEAD